jgi:hypothetical protein
MHRFLGVFTSGFQLCNREGVGRRLVRVDELWLLPWIQTVQRLAQEPLRSLAFRVDER